MTPFVMELTKHSQPFLARFVLMTRGCIKILMACCAEFGFLVSISEDTPSGNNTDQAREIPVALASTKSGVLALPQFLLRSQPPTRCPLSYHTHNAYISINVFTQRHYHNDGEGWGNTDIIPDIDMLIKHKWHRAPSSEFLVFYSTRQ